MGRTVVAWLGAVGGGALGGNAHWWRQVPKAGGEQNLTLLGRGRGALPAVVGFWWWVACGGGGLWVRVVVAASGGGAPSFGCVGDAGGCGAFLLVVGWVGGGDFPR